MANGNDAAETPRLCGACRYDMTSLFAPGVSGVCPECGWVGVPRARAPSMTLARGVFTALAVGTSGLVVLVGGVNAYLAPRLDWGLDEARRVMIAAGGAALVAGCTGVGALLALSGGARVSRLVLASVHVIVVATCLAFLLSDMLRGIVPGWYLLAFVYSGLSIGGLLTAPDVQRAREVASRDRVRRVARVVLVSACTCAAAWAVWFGVTARSQTAAARVFTDLDARVRWEGPYVVSIMAKSRGVSDADLVHLAALPHLRSVYLSNNPITDAGLASVAELEHLVVMDVRGTGVTIEGARRLERSMPRVHVWEDARERER